MSLRNLVGISLEPIEPDWRAIRRLLMAAERNMTDARLPALSAENRFDAAYKAIMQMALLALHAQGYRTLTSKPGHHQTAIQSLAHTVRLPANRPTDYGRWMRCASSATCRTIPATWFPNRPHPPVCNRLFCCTPTSPSG